MTVGEQTISASDTNGGPWLSVSDLAKAKGVTKQTISEKVARLVRDRGLQTRPGSSGVKLVNVAQYDRLVGETSDLSKVQAASTVRALRADDGADSALPQTAAAVSTLPQSAAASQSGIASPQKDGSGETFSEAQKRKTQYEAAIKALDFGERSAQLVAIDEVKSVIERMLEPQLAAIDALALRADEIAAAAVRDGVGGVRLVLKDAVFKLKATVAASWRDLETLGKEHDGGGVQVDLQLPEEELQ